MTEVEELKTITNIEKLLHFLKNRMDWPLDLEVLNEDDPIEELAFDYELTELGIDPAKAPNVRSIKQLRPFHDSQPFGIFCIEFEDKNLKVTSLRRILKALVAKKKTTPYYKNKPIWQMNDLLFITNFGASEHRQISMAHFQENKDSNTTATLRVIGWDENDTPARLKVQAHDLVSKLHYPKNPSDTKAWRDQWTQAFKRTPGETIKDTKLLVEELAKLATNTRHNIEEVMDLETETGSLHSIKKALEEAIFPEITTKAFADMYAQTVAYGLLQARVLHKSGNLALKNEVNNLAGFTNPFLNKLFESFLAVGSKSVDVDFDEIGISEVRDLLSKTNINQVLIDFGNKNPDQDPNIFLYEDFLKEYDKERKDKHGVFYTPKEVVSFIVRSAHEALQKDFGLKDGLADTTTWREFASTHQDIKIPEGWADKHFVQILDPAAGTGTFLLTTIDVINNHLVDKWNKEGKSENEKKTLWQAYVPQHLLPRLHGFELMMAPYAMAHLSIALKLSELGYTPSKDERTQLYLTNTLSEPFDSVEQLSFMSGVLAAEGHGANNIKKNVPITVIIGNPPYSVNSMNVSKYASGKKTWIGKLIQPYFQIDGNPLGERNPKMLNDDYVKFICYSQHRLKNSGIGLLGFITNHSYLDNITFPGMRQSLVNNFQKIHVIDLHGNSSKKETAPDGSKDENVFDIKQGVSIIQAILNSSHSSEVLRSDIYGLRKTKSDRQGKLNILSEKTSRQLSSSIITIAKPNYMFALVENHHQEEYGTFWGLQSVMKTNSVGIATARDNLTINMSPEEALETGSKFISLDEKTARSHFSLGNNMTDWKIYLAQKDLRDHGVSPDKITKIQYRPFDTRFSFYTGNSGGFHSRPRHDVMRHMLGGSNIGLITVRQVAESHFNHVLVTRHPINFRCTLSNKGGGFQFPLKLLPKGKLHVEVVSNYSEEFIKSLSDAVSMVFPPLIKCRPDKKIPKNNSEEIEWFERGDMIATFGCRDIFDYIYAVLHSPVYRTRYIDFLKYDFPRIPLPGNADVFKKLIPLGEQLASLHLLDEKHPKLIKPEIVFRGNGSNRITYTKKEIKWHNGKMPINPNQWFEDVPESSISFSIGGYNPLQKWLHDRAAKGGKNPSDGRVLKSEDVLHYRRMVVAITETQKLMKEIDKVIDNHGGWPGAFKN